MEPSPFTNIFCKVCIVKCGGPLKENARQVPEVIRIIAKSVHWLHARVFTYVRIRIKHVSSQR